MRELFNSITPTPIRYMQIPSGLVDYEATPLRTVDDVLLLYYKKVIPTYTISAQPIAMHEGTDTFKVFDPVYMVDTIMPFI